MSKFQNKSPKVQAKPGSNNNNNNNNNRNNNNNNNNRKFGGNNNTNNAGGNSGKKKAAAPLVVKMGQVSPENCIPCSTTNPLRFVSTVNKNKNQIHHNFDCPTQLQEDGKIRIKFKPSTSGPLNVMVGENPMDRSYSLHLDIFGNYGAAYTATCSEVDSLLSKFNENTTPKQLEADLYKVLKEKGFKTEEIAQIMEDNIPEGTPMAADYYRQVATAFIIRLHLADDKKGQALMAFCVKMKNDYCAYLDAPANRLDKAKIYDLTGLEGKAKKEPAANYVNDIFVHTKHPEKAVILAKKIDYSKSPTISFKIHESIPKGDNTNTDKLIIISESGQALWTKIYDYYANPVATLPISTYEEFEIMTYNKGDSQAGIKPFFKQVVEITSLAPCVFWGEVQRRGTFQFTIATMGRFSYEPFIGGPKEATPEELTKTQAKIRKALAYYNVNPTPVKLPVAPVITNNNDTQSGYDNNSSDGEGEGEGGEGSNEEGDENGVTNNEINENGKRPNGDDVCLDENDNIVQVKKTKFNRR